MGSKSSEYVLYIEMFIFIYIHAFTLGMFNFYWLRVLVGE